MDTEGMSKEWSEAIDQLMELEPARRKHFAMLVVSLAKCYTKKDSWKAVVFVNNENDLLTFSVGADEFEAAQIVHAAAEVMNAYVTADAPEREMYN